MAGLVVAAIFAASMDSNLNSMATLTYCDVYQRYFRPKAGPREALAVLRIATVIWGALGTAIAIAMTRAASALDVWWQMAGMFSGGVVGLFLLGLISRRAGGAGAAIAVALGVLLIVWMSLSPTDLWPETWNAYRNPLHNFLAIVAGTAVILAVGLLTGLWRREAVEPAQLGSKESSSTCRRPRC
jgi:SSS family solute:Na+ symporter